MSKEETTREKRSLDELFNGIYCAAMSGDTDEAQACYVEYLESRFDEINVFAEISELADLVDKGLDVNYPCSKTQETVLFEAAYRLDADYTRHFLEKGADINLQDRHGNCPVIHVDLNTKLHVQEISQEERDSALENAKRTLAVLLEYHPNLDLVNEDGQTVLEYYQENGRPGLTEMLVDYVQNNQASPK